MACVCSKCGETINKPYLVDGAIYGSTCAITVLPKDGKKTKVKKGNWVSAELASPLKPNGHQKATFIYDGKKYSTFGAVTVGGDFWFNGAVISRDQKQIMINLDVWKR